jgi:hypothetical protein
MIEITPCHNTKVYNPDKFEKWTLTGWESGKRIDTYMYRSLPKDPKLPSIRDYGQDLSFGNVAFFHLRRVFCDPRKFDGQDLGAPLNYFFFSIPSQCPYEHCPDPEKATACDTEEWKTIAKATAYVDYDQPAHVRAIVNLKYEGSVRISFIEKPIGGKKKIISSEEFQSPNYKSFFDIQHETIVTPDKIGRDVKSKEIEFVLEASRDLKANLGVKISEIVLIGPRCYTPWQQSMQRCVNN